MISLVEAQAYVLEGCAPLDPVSTRSEAALGLVTAEPIMCHEFVPPFDNTAVDGYAVQAGDTTNAPVDLKVVGLIAAGDAPSIQVTPGTAIRIMTGAPLPDGADAIVMVENTQTSDDDATVTINASISAGSAVRRAGEDMRPGQKVFDLGTLLQPGHLGVLATLGIETIATHQRPRVGVLSTGNELIEGSAELKPGQIRDSNRLTLLSMVTQTGCTAVDLGLIRDDEAAVEAALRSGADDCDAIITSGGVSMGDFDYVKLVLSRIADMRWMQIAIKPAKPMAFGTLDNTPIFGLPGNPGVFDGFLRATRPARSTQTDGGCRRSPISTPDSRDRGGPARSTPRRQDSLRPRQPALGRRSTNDSLRRRPRFAPALGHGWCRRFGSSTRRRWHRRRRQGPRAATAR